jgi:argininosuccinate lyase
VPFREAHGAIGRLLRAADKAKTPLQKLPADAWADAHPAFATGVPALTPEASVENHSVSGGTSRSAVLAQLEAARAALA